MRKKISKIIRTAFILCFLVLSMSITAFASGQGTNVMNGLTNIKTLVLGIISLVGAIFTGLAISEFATAFSDRDTASMKQAGFKIAGGLIMFFATTIMALLGM